MIIMAGRRYQVRISKILTSSTMVLCIKLGQIKAIICTAAIAMIRPIIETKLDTNIREDLGSMLMQGPTLKTMIYIH